MSRSNLIDILVVLDLLPIEGRWLLQWFLGQWVFLCVVVYCFLGECKWLFHFVPATVSCQSCLTIIQITTLLLIKTFSAHQTTITNITGHLISWWVSRLVPQRVNGENSVPASLAIACPIHCRLTTQCMKRTMKAVTILQQGKFPRVMVAMMLNATNFFIRRRLLRHRRHLLLRHHRRRLLRHRLHHLFW